MLVRLIMLGVFAAGIGQAETQEKTSSPPSLKCDTGPTIKMFGGTLWLVYSCADQASMAVVSTMGNPAFPFYFFLRPNGGAYTVAGEGTGDKKASDAAGDALSQMTPAEFAALLAATKAPNSKCEIGPAIRTFGGTSWIVYSCADQASMVAFSAQDNPAFPFYFFLRPNGGAYTVTGEGTGDKKASDAAREALSKMTSAEFAALLAATRAEITSR